MYKIPYEKLPPQVFKELKDLHHSYESYGGVYDRVSGNVVSTIIGVSMLILVLIDLWYSGFLLLVIVIGVVVGFVAASFGDAAATAVGVIMSCCTLLFAALGIISPFPFFSMPILIGVTTSLSLLFFIPVMRIEKYLRSPIKPFVWLHPCFFAKGGENLLFYYPMNT